MSKSVIDVRESMEQWLTDRLNKDTIPEYMFSIIKIRDGNHRYPDSARTVRRYWIISPNTIIDDGYAVQVLAWHEDGAGNELTRRTKHVFTRDEMRSYWRMRVRSLSNGVEVEDRAVASTWTAVATEDSDGSQ